MNEKRNSLEGIRAIACIGVFLCHFRGAFLPNKVIGIIDYTPLKIMTAGYPMWRILFVLSGFVISYKYFRNQQYDDVLIDVVKRWFRIFPGVLVANIIVCMLMKCNLLFNVEAANISGSQDFLGTFNQFTPSLIHAIKEGLFTIYLNGANSYIAPLWTMTYEFLGSILILAAIAVFKGHPLRIIFYFVVLTFSNAYYNYLIVGMLICDIYFNSDINEKLRSKQLFNNIVCLMTAVVICMIQLDDTNKEIRVIYGVLLVVFFVTLLNSQLLEEVLGSPTMVKIGKLSFPIYILHWPIIESFSSWYYIRCWKLCGEGVEGVVILSDFILTLFVVFLAAWLFDKYVISIGMIANSFWKNKIVYMHYK